MWFLMGQIRDKNCKYKNAVELFLRSFNLKNENRKIWVAVILNAVRDSTAQSLHSREL